MTSMTWDREQFAVRFWGVRGSIPCPGLTTVRYGGNTPCVEMRVGGKHLIFDGGTGIRLLGQALLQEMPLSAHLFFTHSHWDHIQGFPFFSPAFIRGNRFDIYGPLSPDGATIKHRLNDQMLHPNFPVPLQVMGADLTFHTVGMGETIDLGEVQVETGLLNHPGEAMGYRVNWQGYAAAYVSDTEHFPDRLDENVLRLAQDVDLLIYDATYTDEEYYSTETSRIGWGHSTWQMAVKVAQAANVKRLAIFHHDPAHDDGFLEQVEEEAREQFPESFLAQEGLVVHLATVVGTELEQKALITSGVDGLTPA